MSLCVCVCGVSVGPAHAAPQAQVGLMFVLPVNKSVDLQKKKNKTEKSWHRKPKKSPEHRALAEWWIQCKQF